MMTFAKDFDRDLVETGKLHLDLDNPRFGLRHAADFQEAFALLAERADLKELWDSIASQGWVSIEPLICIDGSEEGHFIVIEGNRRLAALQTMLDPDLLEPRYHSKIPAVGDELRAQLASVEVVWVSDRRKADAFIGFKHVNGPASWGSLPKAKFANDMFIRSCVDGIDAKSAMTSVAEALGDTTVSLLRMLVAYQVLEQSINEGFVESDQVEGKAFDFSHLYTMMPNPATRDYLGWGDAPLSADLIRENPVAPERLDHLEHLMGWLFGSKDQARVIKSQGADRPKLQKVLAHAAARETLIATRDLDQAAAKAGLDVRAWRDRLIKAEAGAKALLTDLGEVQARLEGGEVEDSIARSATLKATYNTMLASLKSYNED